MKPYEKTKDGITNYKGELKTPESWGKLPDPSKTASGKTLCLCSRCCEIFRSPYSFDYHQIHSHQTCRNPEEMREMGMIINDKGLWIAPQGKNQPMSSIAVLDSDK